MEKLLGYDWQGNVRDIQNVIERAIILSTDSRLDFEFFALHTILKDRDPIKEIATESTLDEGMKAHIESSLQNTKGRRAHLVLRKN